MNNVEIKQTQIANWIGRLEKEIGLLKERQTELIEKLHPILKEFDPFPENAPETEQQLVPLASEIRKHVACIEGMRDQVNSAMERLEL